MSVFFYFSSVLLSILCLQHVVITPVTALPDAERLSSLKKLTSSNRGGLITTTPSQFQPYLEDAPRSYNLIVMFSADPQLCQPCSSMKEQLRIVSSEYHSLSKNKVPTFFFEVKLSQSDSQFLQYYGVQHVPLLFHFGSGTTKTYPKRLEESSPNSYNVQQMGYHSNVIKSFVNQRTGSKLKVTRSGYEIPFVKTVRQFMPLIFGGVALFSVVAIYTGAFRNPMLWFGIVVLVYIFSVGGGHYSWIHDTPLAVVDKAGRMQYIAGGSRSQYVAEGFFVSFTCVCISGLVIAIQELPSVIPFKGTQTALGMSMFFMTIGAIGSLLSLYQMVSFILYIILFVALRQKKKKVFSQLFHFTHN